MRPAVRFAPLVVLVACAHAPGALTTPAGTQASATTTATSAAWPRELHVLPFEPPLGPAPDYVSLLRMVDPNARLDERPDAFEVHDAAGRRFRFASLREPYAPAEAPVRLAVGSERRFVAASRFGAWAEDRAHSAYARLTGATLGTFSRDGAPALVALVTVERGSSNANGCDAREESAEHVAWLCVLEPTVDCFVEGRLASVAYGEDNVLPSAAAALGECDDFESAAASPAPEDATSGEPPEVSLALDEHDVLLLRRGDEEPVALHVSELYRAARPRGGR